MRLNSEIFELSYPKIALFVSPFVRLSHFLCHLETHHIKPVRVHVRCSLLTYHFTWPDCRRHQGRSQEAILITSIMMKKSWASNQCLQGERTNRCAPAALPDHHLACCRQHTLLHCAHNAHCVHCTHCALHAVCCGVINTLKSATTKNTNNNSKL